VRAWRKRFFWPFFLLTTIGSGEAQIGSNSDPGKPLLITPSHIQRPPIPLGRKTSHTRRPPTPPSKKTPSCLSQTAVHGGRLKYKMINDRRCWYLARPADNNAPLPRKTKPTGQEIVERPTAAECREQAMKLDADEKRLFLRQCMSGKK
jgi:hypothetical protein